MYKIGVVGDKDSILSFKAIGIDVYPVVDEKEAQKTVDKMARDNYGVIFITENIAQNIEETISRYSKNLVPAIILIPNNQGSLGIGLKNVVDNVEKAIGVNILEEGR